MLILIHSPLVGPLTWQPVAEVLRQRGYAAVAPTLIHDPHTGIPYWQQHVQAVVQAVVAADRGLKIEDRSPFDPQSSILVAHSGGGMLLPAIRQALASPVGAYIFVDAGIPQNGKSRLDLFAAGAEEFRQAAVNGFLPTWTGEDLREAIPDALLRAQFVAELQPMPLAVYEEPIPVFASWPDAPCAYLGFSQSTAYADAIARADREGWPRLELPGGHFQMLVDPEQVAEALLALAKRIHYSAQP